ncbi:MAG: ABC transporter substrate-binding protein [Sarcina sp.]
MKKRMISVAMIAVLAMGGLVSCGGEKQTSGVEEIKIGTIAPLTGKVSSFGQSAKEGIELAEKQINEDGGVNGKKVKFLIEDDQGDQNVALNVFNKLVDQNKVNVILGPLTSAPTLAVSPKAASYKIPMLTPAATEPTVTNIGGGYVFRGCYIDSFQGEVMSKFAKETLKKENVAILYNVGSDFSKGIAEAFKKDFETKGGKVVAFESYNNDDKDFNAQLTKIKGTNPEAIFLPDYYNVVALIAKQARDNGIEATLLGVDGWESEELLSIAGNSINNSYYINHFFAYDEYETVSKFVKEYEETYKKKPDTLAALYYDGAMTIYKALKEADSLSNEDILKALKKVEVKGVTGNIRFGEDNSAVKDAVILKIDNGKKELVEKIAP